MEEAQPMNATRLCALRTLDGAVDEVAVGPALQRDKDSVRYAYATKAEQIAVHEASKQTPISWHLHFAASLVE